MANSNLECFLIAQPETHLEYTFLDKNIIQMTNIGLCYFFDHIATQLHSDIIMKKKIDQLLQEFACGISSFVLLSGKKQENVIFQSREGVVFELMKTLFEMKSTLVFKDMELNCVYILNESQDNIPSEPFQGGLENLESFFMFMDRMKDLQDNSQINNEHCLFKIQLVKQGKVYSSLNLVGLSHQFCWEESQQNIFSMIEQMKKREIIQRVEDWTVGKFLHQELSKNIRCFLFCNIQDQEIDDLFFNIKLGGRLHNKGQKEFDINVVNEQNKVIQYKLDELQNIYTDIFEIFDKKNKAFTNQSMINTQSIKEKQDILQKWELQNALSAQVYSEQYILCSHVNIYQGYQEQLNFLEEEQMKQAQLNEEMQTKIKQNKQIQQEIETQIQLKIKELLQLTSRDKKSLHQKIEQDSETKPLANSIQSILQHEFMNAIEIQKYKSQITMNFFEQYNKHELFKKIAAQLQEILEEKQIQGQTIQQSIQELEINRQNWQDVSKRKILKVVKEDPEKEQIQTKSKNQDQQIRKKQAFVEKMIKQEKKNFSHEIHLKQYISELEAQLQRMPIYQKE